MTSDPSVLLGSTVLAALVSAAALAVREWRPLSSGPIRTSPAKSHASISAVCPSISHRGLFLWFTAFTRRRVMSCHPPPRMPCRLDRS